MTFLMAGAARPKNQNSKLIIFGRGHWGTALGGCLADSGFEAHFIDQNDPLDIPPKSLVVLATPFSEVSGILNRLSSRKDLLGVINASKGIDRETLKTFSSLASRMKFPIGTLTGPTFAKELQEKKPTACVLAGKNKKWVATWSRLFSNSYFRVYEHHDPRGVEVCAAVKNVLAIGAGISDGLGLGNNARAALLTRGLMEMMKLCRILGGRPSSVFGLAGMGDLWLTATGDLSRNRTFGKLLADGLTPQAAVLKIGQTIEGLYTVRQVEKIRKKNKIVLPICEEIFRVAIGGDSAKDALRRLMSRQTKLEESSSLRIS